MSENKGNKSQSYLIKSLDPSAVIQRPQPTQPQLTQPTQGVGSPKPATPKPSEGEGKK